MHGSADGTAGTAGAEDVVNLAPQRNAARPALLELLALAAVLAVALWLRLGDWNEPFTGKGWQHMSARLALMARNFAEHGYRVTHFAPAADSVPPADGRWDIYLNHPPLLSMTVSLAFRAFGVHEWSARLVMVASSLGALLALWALARRLLGPGAALVSAALAATAPITAFYGSMLCENGSLLLLFLALALLLYVRQLDRPTRAGWWLLMLVLLLAAATDWQGHLLMAALAAHQLWLGRRGRAAALIGALLAMVALHAALMLGARSVTLGADAVAAGAGGAANSGGDAAGGGMLAIFWSRSWGGVSALGTPGEIAHGLWHHLRTLYTSPVLLLAALGLLGVRRARWPSLLFVLLLFGVGDTLVFLEGAVRHEFWNVTLAPALFTLAGLGAAGVASVLRPERLRVLALVALAIGAAAPGALATQQRFDSIRDDYFHTLGLVIEQHTQPDDLVGTCEFWSDPLAWYARRKVDGDLTDRWIPAAGLPASLAPAAAFVIPERPFAPHEHARLLALLGAAYRSEVVPTAACGPVHIFDLRHRLP